MTDHESGEDRTEAIVQNLYNALSQVTDRAADAGFDSAAGLARFNAWLSDQPQTPSPDQAEAPVERTASARTEGEEPLPYVQNSHAARLIAATRSALAQSGEVQALMEEAWQALALAQAVGSRLAVSGPPVLRDEALGLAELAGRGCDVIGPPVGDINDMRVAQLTELGDTRQVLIALSALLGDVGIALVGIACAAGDEAAYWQCTECIDAADESRVRVLDMLGLLAVQDQEAVKRGSADG